MVDLKSGEGQAIVKALAEQSDVLVENFKPGKMEEWGLGPERLQATNPDLARLCVCVRERMYVRERECVCGWWTVGLCACCMSECV